MAISRFAALTLAEKIDAIGVAAMKFEKKLEVRGRGLGHPGDRPLDYLEGVGAEMLGVTPSCNNAADALFRASVPSADLLRRAGLSISDHDARLVYGIDGLAIASSTTTNDFIGFIHGWELNVFKPQTSATPYYIRSPTLAAKLLQTSGCFKKVFLGSFSFVDATSRDLERCEREFSCVTWSKQRFQYGSLDLIFYAAGIEFA